MSRATCRAQAEEREWQHSQCTRAWPCRSRWCRARGPGRRFDRGQRRSGERHHGIVTRGVRDERRQGVSERGVESWEIAAAPLSAAARTPAQTNSVQPGSRKRSCRVHERLCGSVWHLCQMNGATNQLAHEPQLGPERAVPCCQKRNKNRAATIVFHKNT